MSIPYSATEQEALARTHARGEPLACPRCSVVMDTRPVWPRKDVSYVRHRLWLVCPSCGGTVILDLDELR